MNTFIALSMLMLFRIGMLLAIGRQLKQSALSFAAIAGLILWQYVTHDGYIKPEYRFAIGLSTLIILIPALMAFAKLRTDNLSAKRYVDIVTLILFAALLFYQISRLV